jgi:hypothetical protein
LWHRALYFRIPVSLSFWEPGFVVLVSLCLTERVCVVWRPSYHGWFTVCVRQGPICAHDCMTVGMTRGRPPFSIYTCAHVIKFDSTPLLPNLWLSPALWKMPPVLMFRGVFHSSLKSQLMFYLPPASTLF